MILIHRDGPILRVELARPEKKNAIVVDAATGHQITNVCWLSITREWGEVVFQPRTAPGDYWVYYLLYRPKGPKNYPKGDYELLAQTGEIGWLKKHGLDDPRVANEPLSEMLSASLVQFQSIDQFNSFYIVIFIIKRLRKFKN